MQIINMKWSESETIKLVELYAEFPCIWNISHRDYKDKNKRNAAYEYIVGEMGKENFGVAELKQKIKNLRCTYNQEKMKIKKTQKSGSGSNEVYEPSIKWYKIMDTLLKSITRSSTETRDNFETIQSENSVLENECEVSRTVRDPQPSTSTQSSSVINDSQQPITSSAQNIEDSQLPQITPTLKGKGKGKTSKNKNLQLLSSAVNEVRKVHESLRNGNETAVGAQSVNNAFGSYVALMLDKMSFEQSLRAQSEIQSILVRFLTSSNSNTSMQSNASTPIHSVITPERQYEQHYVYIPETQDASQSVLQNDVIYVQETQNDSQSILQSYENEQETRDASQSVLQNDVIYVQQTQNDSQSILQRYENVQETQDASQYAFQSEVNDQETQEATQSILNEAWSSANIN